ncbi:MAG: penicillin-binding protein 2 [Acidimicrobiia bacterium]
MNSPIRRLALFLLAIFGLLVLDLTYVQVVAGPGYRDDVRNPRLAASRSSRERGPIISREGIVLAESVNDPDSAQSFLRLYPEDDLYAHVVGYSSLLFADSGLEEARDTGLRSDRDLTISGLIDAFLGRETGAKGIRLTISNPVQQAAQRELAGQAGAIVAIEPTTGEILAMYSSPSFSPADLLGEFSGPGDALTANETHPLTNRAIEMTFAPGSSFKVITAAAALESGLANPDTSFINVLELELPGSTAVIRNADRDRCGEGESVDLAGAFRRSCNTIFGQLGIDLGLEVIGEIAADFGFNRVLPFELTTVESSFPVDPLVGDPAATAQSAIGQRDVRATPLQMAMVAAAVANRGLVMQPYVISEEFDRELNILEQFQPVEVRRAVSPGTAATLSRMMEDVVSFGTGRRAAIEGVAVGGKTGTAEVPGQPPHAWFIGYARSEERQIAVAVVIENGGNAGEDATGGAVAAPMAREVMRTWLESTN